MFTHYDTFHLFANMITLYFFGSFLNRLVGSRKFLLVYFGGGILGSLFFIILASPSTAIGASGAVFALGGAMAVMAPKLRVIIFPIPAPIPLWVAVVGIFVILTVLPMLNVFSNIAWEAHLGGLLFGLVAGYIFKGKGRYYA
jgi:membrane associated rhomboid family serine protease